MKRKTNPKTLLLLLLVILFAIISILAFFYSYFSFDIAISQSVQDINSQIFSKLMWFVSGIGNQPFMIILVGLISTALFFRGLRQEAVFASLSAAGSALLGSIIKLIVDRPRPEAGLVHVSVWLSDKSYPSNHVLVFTVFFGFLLYLLIKKSRKNYIVNLLILVLFLLISSIGISRIYLGAHWPSDVLGGYLLGLVWLAGTIKLYHHYYGQR